MKNNQAFKKLVVGQILANIGDTIYTVAVVSSIFSLTHSALAASIVPVLITGGTIISGLLVPMIITHFSITSVIKVSQSCKVLILFLLAIYLQYRIAQPNVIIIYLLVAGISFFDGFTDPISMALVPHYVEKELLMKANSLFSTLLQLVSIGSWAIGSSLLIVFTINEIVWLDLLIFIISATIFWFLPKIQIAVNVKKNKKENLLSGWHEIRTHEIIKTVVVMDVLESIANTAWVSAIILVFVRKVLHVSDNWWGYINATYFIGAMIGSLIVMRLSKWINKNKSKSIYWGSFISAIATVIVSISWNPILILVCSIFIGLFSQIKNIPQATAVQQKMSKSKLAAIYASTGVLYTGAFSISILLMGVISDLCGVRIVFVLSGALLLLVAIIARKKKNLFD